MANINKKLKRARGLHQKKKKQTSVPHGAFPGQSVLQQALALHQTGRLAQAESLYRQILQAEPHHPQALYYLGLLSQHVGKNSIAAEFLSRAIAGKPDYVEAFINLGILLKNQGRLDEAITNFRQALSLKPDLPLLHYNLGVTLNDQGRLDEAIACYRKALSLKPDFAEAHCNLGVALKNQGKIDEAIACFRQALSLKPDYDAMIYINWGKALIVQGKLEEALRVMQIAVEKAPGDSRIGDHLLLLLNNFMPSIDTGGSYVTAQQSLQQVRKEYTSALIIADETVREIYQQCRSILALHKLDIDTSRTELFRGVITENNCHRHLMVFNTYNIIPEYCFDCFKVTFEPQTVVDLFKLLLVFDKLTLPKDNPRKCMVEVRPKISGAYKGFIYCRSLDEGKEILNSVQPIVSEALSTKIPIFVKRGCSEFLTAFPSYGHITGNKIQQMSYNEEWRKYEADADKNMGMPFKNPNNFTSNHSGFTLLDVLVMRKWLEYAVRIGDLSYLKIAEQP